MDTFTPNVKVLAGTLEIYLSCICVSGVGGQVSMNFVEDFYYVTIIVFVNMKIIIDPLRETFLAPLIFLVTLEPGGLVAPVHIYLQWEGCIFIIPPV